MPNPRDTPTPPAGPTTTGGGVSRSKPATDWTEIVRPLERKRRALTAPGSAVLPLPPDYYIRATWSSFRLDGMDVSEQDVRFALSQHPSRQPLRSRQAQRLRNHSAILHHIENNLRQSLPLTTGAVLRWYTTISAGLSTTAPDQAAASRLDERVRRINSPQLRLAAAIPEIAAVHLSILADPTVPSFGGILARLLLRYHLGRCNLPPAIFDPATDAQIKSIEALSHRLIHLLETACDQLTTRTRGAPSE